MRIAILTQPLGKNYGGILQAYALQQILLSLGYDTVVIDRQENYPSFKLMVWRIASVIKCIVSKYIRRDPNILIQSPISNNYITDKRLVYDYSELNDFVVQHIKRTNEIRTSSRIKRFLIKNNIHRVIVGSDQVWREEYSPCITDFFGSFLCSCEGIRIVSYAASFGLETIPISINKQPQCRALLNRFHSVSVRENSAVRLLQKEWNINAELVLDPTLLLERSMYENLIDKRRESKVGLFYYILDESNEKQQIANKISDMLNIDIEQISLYPRDDFGNAGKLSSISDWLYCVAHSKFILTDSYHGCVFSIIFNKPFIVIANRERGIDRFKTLLDSLALSHRLVYSSNQISEELLEENVNYVEVNRLLYSKIQESLDFLKKALSDDGINYRSRL